MTYDEWFQSQQGTAYDGSYRFAKAAWKHQAARIEELEQLAKEMDVALNGAIEWDKLRTFIMPYRVRDPIHAAQKRYREVCGGEK